MGDFRTQGVPFLGAPFKGILLYLGTKRGYPHFGKYPCTFLYGIHLSRKGVAIWQLWGPQVYAKHMDPLGVSLVVDVLRNT